VGKIAKLTVVISPQYAHILLDRMSSVAMTRPSFVPLVFAIPTLLRAQAAANLGKQRWRQAADRYQFRHRCGPIRASRRHLL